MEYYSVMVFFLLFFYLGVKSPFNIQNAWGEKERKRDSRIAFADAFSTPTTYSVSVLAGNLGRISMSLQQIV